MQALSLALGHSLQQNQERSLLCYVSPIDLLNLLAGLSLAAVNSASHV